jgi:type I restriction enzyme M protein
MFEQSFKNIDNVLRNDSGCATELDYIEQTSWILFLKYLDDLEETKKREAALGGKEYQYILDPLYHWNTWACPKNSLGSLDQNKVLDGDDLNDFVNLKLFPYLKSFKSVDADSTKIEYKIGEIFSELKNKLTSGYTLRQVLNIVDGMSFRLYEEKHELSHLYESKIKKMGNAGRNGGEYYTPRPLINAIIKAVDPKIGQTVYDGACGSAGFLVEAYNYLKQNDKDYSTVQIEKLQKSTFYGKEIKSLAFVIAIMNMILHGIEAPNVKHMDTLAENINDIQDKDRYDIVLANPPFGGTKLRKSIQQNFNIQTGEPAYLFLQHYIKILKAGGSAGIIIKNTFLSNTDNASIALRKYLLETCNLHTVLDLPGGVFQAGVKTVVLFFNKGEPTRKIWYYQLNLDRNLGKTNPLSEKDLEEFITLQKNKKDSQNSWIIDANNIDPKTYDLSVKNPNKKEEKESRDPKEILEEIKKLDEENKEILLRITELL